MPHRPEVRHAIMALGLTLTLALLLFFAFGMPLAWHVLLGIWLLAINLVTFAFYGYDKRCAQANRRRVPEVVLHGLVLAGGSVGGYAGMSLFRHKTMKTSFRLVFWVLATLHLLLAAALLYRAWKQGTAA